MEVSRQNVTCACHLRGMHDAGKLQKLLSPGIHQTSLCPPISAKSPAREVFSTAFSKCDDYSSSRTLEGVLRGQVPSLFTNLCAKSNVGRHLEQEINQVNINSRPSSLSPSTLFQLTCPGRSTPSTPSVPLPSELSLKRSYSDSEQAEPIDLSCKKMRSDIPNSRRDYLAMDARLDNSPSPSRRSACSPCTLANPRTNSKGPSLLRNLLCLGKDLETSPHRFALENNSINRSPVDEIRPAVPESMLSRDYQISRPPVESRVPWNPQSEVSTKYNGLATTKVTLAKKNMLPVSARVSDWLVKIIRFAKSIPEFINLLHNDKLALILNSWARLLLLYMAEHNFQFVVTPDLREQFENSHGQNKDYASSQECPTMKSVESVQTFIRKCQNMGIDSKEYAFLRMAVLFNAGIRGLDRADIVDRLNSSVQQLLQQHVQASRPRDLMHYSRLLMSLPALYGINCKMIENLFCRHINGNMDMEVLMKEMLQNI